MEISRDQVETAASEYVVFDSARNHTVLFGIKKTSAGAPPLGESALVVVR